MIHRKTQKAEYWASFVIQPDDAELIYGYLLEEGKPQRTVALARKLLTAHVERENEALRQQLSSDGIVYRPQLQFAVGDKLNFPILGFLNGSVTEIRPGANSGGEQFDVIRVQFGTGAPREFAAGLKTSHKLNDLDVSTLVQSDNLKSPEELFELYGAGVSEAVGAALEKNQELIRIGEEWFLRAMMAEVNVGHLNLAEAVLDMVEGRPLTTTVILRDLGLPEDVATNVQEASLNSALGSDARFDEVSLTDQPAWVLRRLEPAEVREMPAALRASDPAGTTTLSDELQALIVQIDDELDSDLDTTITPEQTAETVLNFSHRRAGTLGWNRTLAKVLPRTGKPRIPVTLRDRMSNKEYLVWLVEQGRYIWGLADFYKSAELPAGAQIVISRTEHPQVFIVDAKRRKPKREWVRVASMSNHHLRLDTAQRAVACDADDLMAVFVDDIGSLDALRASRDVSQAVREAFLEIAKLSPQGNVHARTLYAVVNALVRASARSVFSALVANGAYVPVGDNYWHLGGDR